MAKLDYTTIPPLRDSIFEYTRSYSNWGSDYSITSLIRAPREIMLQNRHKAEIDAQPFTHELLERNLKSFRGTAIHNHFEYMLRRHINKNRDAGYEIEARVWDRINDRKISGKFDAFKDGILYDFKTTSVWKRIMGTWKDFECQLNMYDYLLHTCNVEVTRLEIIAWYMDWDKDKLWKDPEYPKQEIEQVVIENKWTRDAQKDYLWKRIELMKDNEELPDDDLDECTDDETWAKPTVYAVMRPGQKKAVKAAGLTSRKKAWHYIRNVSNADDKDTFYVQKRFGARTKCENFCSAAPFCNQYQAFLADMEKEKANDKKKEKK